ncbi:MAG: hypothetical protein WB952_13940 [Terriglobales bacterium]
MSLFLALGLPALAQQGTAATVSFTCDFPGSDPSHYGISVSSDGHASYVSDGKLARDSEPDAPFTQDFTLPAASVAHIIDLAKQAHYFEGKIDSGKKNLASTGEKTLVYKDAQRSATASYNYSLIPAVEDLTSLFQSLSATLEFGRRIEFERHYQKLALDDELKSLEDMASRGEVVEVTVIAPILLKVLGDQSVMNTVRARAQRLLDRPSPGAK